MKIAIGSDHGGFELKQHIISHLEARNFEIKDCGTYNLDSVDYPDYGKETAESVADGDCDLGIVVCTTGQGIMISANKVKGIRCALLSDVYSAEMTRMHNDTNMIALGGGVVGKGLAVRIVDAWLDAEFEGGRHERRVNKITDIESKYCR